MSNLQPYFNAFDRSIKLTPAQKSLLKDKSRMLQQELKQWFRKELGITPSFVLQGSFAMGTSVQPLRGADYDVDIGLILDGLDTRAYPDPVAIKELVYNACTQYSSRQVRIKEPCVTVQYHQKGEPGFHVDLAIYGKNAWTGARQLARGKRHSGERFRRWEDASPQHLRERLTQRFSDAKERQQFYRIIRYLKRWKDLHFTKVGHNTPPGIALTAMAYHWLYPHVVNYSRQPAVDDLAALIQLVQTIRQQRYGVDITLPVPPGNPILAKLYQSENHLNSYRQKVDQLYEHLRQAQQAEQYQNLPLALIHLRKIFGPTF